jgi:hypothetical protein
MRVVKTALQGRLAVGLGQATEYVLAENSEIAGQRMRALGFFGLRRLCRSVGGKCLPADRKRSRERHGYQFPVMHDHPFKCLYIGSTTTPLLAWTVPAYNTLKNKG